MDNTDAMALRAWLRLLQTDGVGSQTARALLSAFGMPQAVFEADLARLLELVPQQVAQALLRSPSARLSDLIERTLEWAAQPGHSIMTLADADYPSTLLNIADPPLLLYLKGRIELLAAPALAVVGSRNATTQGRLNAEQFSAAVSQAGVTVISGLALGVDTAAHLGGLRGRGASIAVVGTGLDIDYPSRNRALAQRLAQEGCMVSEYALGTPPMARNFPRRNRLISGLARAVLVVEAALRSGSLITARMAAEQGRDVMAIPGSIHASLSKGCHLLIKQGAMLVESVDDILHALGALPQSPAARQLPSPFDPASISTAAGGLLLQAMGFDPVAADDLSVRCGIAVAQLQAQLLQLELDGCIECLPGGRYRRIN